MSHDIASCTCACHNGPHHPCDQPGGCGLPANRRRGRDRGSDVCGHGDTRDHCPTCQRGRLLADLAAVVSELFDEVTTRELVPTAAIPGYRPPTGRPAPKRVPHTTTAPGLITQLEDAAGTRPARDHLVEAGPARGPRYGADVTGGGKPGSRPPGSLTALETLTQIETAAIEVRRRTDRHAGLTTLPRARGLRGEIQHLTWLLGTRHAHGDPLVDDRHARAVLHAARSWATDARVTLSYLAPVVTLNVRCPDCGGDMRVRKDASSDVWCAGTVEGPALDGDPWPVRCGARWPRITWVQLLDQVNHEQEVAV